MYTSLVCVTPNGYLVEQVQKFVWPSSVDEMAPVHGNELSNNMGSINRV